MIRKRFLIAWALGLAAVSVVAAAEDERLRLEIEEETQARLFVVPLRLEAVSSAKQDVCAELSPADLKISIRGKPLKGKVIQERIARGLITLDRRPRPMLHAMVFDTSGSMSLDLPEAKAAARAYIDSALTELDKGMIVSFDDGVTLWQRVTADRPRLHAAVDQVEISGQTSLFDALVHTIRELDAYRERPVIVLLSDGSDNASFYDVEDVIAELERRPDLIVFSIGLGRRSSDVRETLERLAHATKGRYFDARSGRELGSVFSEIRGILANEATLSVVDPDPGADKGDIEVASTRKGCPVTALGRSIETPERAAAREPIEVPLPQLPIAYSKPLSQSHRKILQRAQNVQSVRDCVNPRKPPRAQLATWDFSVESSAVHGCAPDIVLSHGYLYEPGADPFIGRNDRIDVMIRPFSMDIPEFEKLADHPVRLLDALLEDLPENFSPSMFRPESRDVVADWLASIPTLVHGTTFLEMRPRLARALMSQPGYAAWAMDRLRQSIESDVERIERRYRTLFPDYTDDAVRFAANNSTDAMAARSRLEAPTEVDLQPFLAAWLGDIESYRLFGAWEREQANRRLRGEESPEQAESFVQGWRKLRDLLSLPSNARVVAPLVPMYEPDCDCVGFYRIVLPRPGLMRSRTREHSVFFTGPRLDVAPNLPFAYAMMRALEEQTPEAWDRLREQGYRVVTIDYELLGPPQHHDPLRAFRETRVRLELDAPNEEQISKSRRMTLTGELHLAVPPQRPAGVAGARKLPPRRPRWLLDTVETKIVNDPELKRAFRELDTAVTGYELLRGTMPPVDPGSEGTLPGSR